MLASAGASSVVLACRNMQLASAAVEKIRAQLPAGSPCEVSAMQCDLASLQSVRQFAKEYNSLKRPLHALGRPPRPMQACLSRLSALHVMCEQARWRGGQCATRA